MTEVNERVSARNPDDDAKPSKGQKVEISVNNRPVVLPDDHATGAEIKSAAGVPAEFKLYDSKGHEIGDDKRVKIKDGDRFTAISGQDVS